MRIILLLICCSVWTIGHAQSSWQEALNEQATMVTSRTWTDGSPYLTFPTGGGTQSGETFLHSPFNIHV